MNLSLHQNRIDEFHPECSEGYRMLKIKKKLTDKSASNNPNSAGFRVMAKYLRSKGKSVSHLHLKRIKEW